MATAIVVQAHAVRLANGNGVAVLAESKSGNWYRLSCPANLLDEVYTKLLTKIRATERLNTKHWVKHPWCRS